MKTKQFLEELKAEGQIILQAGTELFDVHNVLHRIEETQIITQQNSSIQTNILTVQADHFVWFGIGKNTTDVMLERLLDEYDMVILTKTGNQVVYYTIDRNKEETNRCYITKYTRELPAVTLCETKFKRVLKKIFQDIFIK